MPFFDRQFDSLARILKRRTKRIILRFKRYIRRLLFPVYFFPIKLITYSAYYLIKFSVKFLISIVRIIIDTIVFPFTGLKNFLKTIFILGACTYMVASVFVITDYLRNEYGQVGKFFCAYNDHDELQNKIVRVVGGYSEGSGFFIEPTKVMTNFHVIADEPSPKIILPDGEFITAQKITGDRNADVAVIEVNKAFPDIVIGLPDRVEINENEPVLAVGYPWGTELTGEATVMKGNFMGVRHSRQMPVTYIQTNISLVEGMSGGPLVDQCGDLVGINTMGVAGLSMFIMANEAVRMMPDLSDTEITKISVDPSLSPAAAVEAFYTYLKARRMEEGFKLLSTEYLQKTNFQEWTSRFKDVLDVEVIVSRPYRDSDDTVFVKFSTKNWVDNEVEIHFYEGTWQTVLEEGVYKMRQSRIIEVHDPSWSWYYDYDTESY